MKRLEGRKKSAEGCAKRSDRSCEPFWEKHVISSLCFSFVVCINIFYFYFIEGLEGKIRNARSVTNCIL